MNIKKFCALALILCILLPLILLSFITVTQYKDYCYNTVKNHLVTTSYLQKDKVNSFLENNINNMRNIVDALKDNNEKDFSQVSTNILDYEKKRHSYIEDIYFVDSEDIVTSSTNEQTIGTKSVFDTNMSKYLQDVLITNFKQIPYLGNLTYFSVAVPIYEDNEYQGYIWEIFNTSYFKNNKDNQTNYKTYKGVIIDSNNNALYINKNDLLYKNLDNFYDNLNNSKKLNSDNGYFDFYSNSKKHFCYYTKINQNDWYYVQLVSYNDIYSPLNNIKNTVFISIFCICIVLIIVVFSWLSYFIKRVNSIIIDIDSMSRGNLTKRLSPSRFNEFSKILLSFNKLLDVMVHDKNQLAKLYDDTKVYKFALDVTTDLNFEANVTKNIIISSSGNLCSNSNSNLYDKNIEKSSRLLVHPNFQNDVINMFNIENIEKIYKSKHKDIEFECLFRKNKEDSYHWVLISIIPFKEGFSNNLKIVSYVKNINDRKVKELRAVKKSQLDGLTQIYNKAFVQSLIKQHLVGLDIKNNCAFIIIDIDNFKNINDTFGHIVGDKVIKEFAHKIVNQFRSYDIIGRIGGDEFVVFLKDIPTKSVVDQIMSNVVHSLCYEIKDKNKTFNISCSIGVSFFPNDGVTYNELYKKADFALYEAKHKSKNCYCIYNSNLTSNFSQIICNDSKDNVLIEMYKSIAHCDNPQKKAMEIIEYIGTKHNITRIFHIDISRDQKHFSTRFEWVAEGFDKTMEHIKNSPLDAYNNYSTYFNSKNLFYCKDVRRLDDYYYNCLEGYGVIALLQYAIYDVDTMTDVVGFDDCVNNRYWSQDCVEAIHIIGKLAKQNFI